VAKSLTPYLVLLLAVVHVRCAAVASRWEIPSEHSPTWPRPAALGDFSISFDGLTWVDGRIFDLTTQQPIEFARVSASPALMHEIVTDEKGRFRIPIRHKPSAKKPFRIIVRKEGFLSSDKFYSDKHAGGIYLKRISDG